MRTSGDAVMLGYSWQVIFLQTAHRELSSVTTVEAALAAVGGMAEMVGAELSVRSLQEYHAS